MLEMIMLMLGRATEPPADRESASRERFRDRHSTPLFAQMSHQARCSLGRVRRSLAGATRLAPEPVDRV